MPMLDWLVYPVNLTPHGYCLLWAPGLIWLHAGSDAVIALAYFSIPLALAVFAHKRRDLEFRWVFLPFVFFILACGFTHVLSIYTLWVPAYGLEGLIKAITALLSVATAFLLWPLMPRLLALPSPAQLALVNASLTEKVGEQEETYRKLLSSDEQVRIVNAQLEARVSQRTGDLVATNERLRVTLDQLQVARRELEGVVAERTAALAQRDLLLREVYHRVKNNLQIVDSVILMQSNSSDDPAAKAFLGELRARVYALGLVHQQLMTSSDYKTFDLAPFLRELTENLLTGGASGQIALEIDACPLPVELDQAVPMALIVTELVTNSLKHAFPDGHGKLTIVVELKEDDSEADEIILSVADNGIGLPVASPDGEKPATGIGTRLVNGLLRQLRGRMTSDSSSAGLTTRLYLPHSRTN